MYHDKHDLQRIFAPYGIGRPVRFAERNGEPAAIPWKPYVSGSRNLWTPEQVERLIEKARIK